MSSRAPTMIFSSKTIAACALMVLLAIGVLSFRNTIRDEDDRGWVIHTHLVLERLRAVLGDITEAETGQRGYLLTGQERYLGPYSAGLNQSHQDLAELRRLTSDNPVEQDAIKRLEPLIAARIAGFADRIEIRRRSGLMAGVDALTATDGEELMAQIRALIAEMRRTEEQLLARRVERAIASARRMKIVIVLGNALAIVFLLMAGLIIHRETSKRNLAEHELRHANADLERRTVELSDTNLELESFSYSVAHDLRAPLRQIAGYSRVLIQDHGSQLDAEAQRYLEKVEDGARKMGRLVDDLLSLSKIGRQELSMQVTPLDSVLRNVVEELAPECSGRDIEWQIGDLFSAECDPGLMKQVFVNLLSNAVKYTRRRDHTVIQVGQMNGSSPPVIFVRDNGVGFEMQYVGKLFGVFQRLHKARDFEGTGVGLAIAQRIIRKHGGRIWAEAELDKGATFFFTLGSPVSTMNENPEFPLNNEVINVARS
ncbi:MAG: CHASE3 domain-containing protein [Candidatus Sulfotelmatobacter sp.]